MNKHTPGAIMGAFNLSSEDWDAATPNVRTALEKCAAAPDLLAALETAYAQLQGAWARTHIEEIRQAMITVRDAATEAKGESQ